MCQQLCNVMSCCDLFLHTPLYDGTTSSPGPGEKKSLCRSFCSIADVKYQDRQTRCVASSSIAGSSERMLDRSMRMLKTLCATGDTPGTACFVRGLALVRRSARASVGVESSAGVSLTLKWQDGLCVCQCARWQAFEQYETVLQRAQCLRLSVVAHEAQVVRSVILDCCAEW